MIVLPTNARWIVCERSGLWTAALRWAGDAHAGLWVEVRSIAQLREALPSWPASFVFLEATVANSEDVLQFLWAATRDFPHSRTAVVSTRECDAWLELFREAGAVDASVTPRRTDRLVHLARRHLDRVVPPPQSPRQRIWQRLPWPEASG